MIKKIIIILLFSSFSAFAQIEHIHINHPVYDFLLRAETKGLLKHFSLSQLPLQRKEITKALNEINNAKNDLTSGEIKSLENFLTEFEITPRKNAVVFYSESDSNQVLFSGLFKDQEKFIYRYKDSVKSSNVSPFGSLESIIQKNEKSSDKVIFGNLGVRFYGTIQDKFGYYLQASNGMVLSGNKKLALEDSRIAQNIKFIYLNSDFDFSDSHVRYDDDWFYAIIGRENRLSGAGLNQHSYISTNAPPMDGISVGARFKSFEYRFSHFGLIGYHDSLRVAGSEALIPAKTLVTHRFAVKPDWGEIGFSESIIYSNRSFDPAYLNPLSFFKSLEHALRDRDNSLMGLDLTLRPMKNFQIKGTFYLDDIKFEEIGKNYWSNKYAGNIALLTALPANIDLGFEYARVEPFTYSHFNFQNALTNDSLLFAGSLQPNSDETSLLMQFWYGNRYPIKLRFSYIRHGKNFTDSTGKITKNIGGDVYHTVDWQRDGDRATFLNGVRENILTCSLGFAYELTRGFHLDAYYKLRLTNDVPDHIFRIAIKFEDF
jgi:hypothetical protein